MKNCNWTGNTRELENLNQRAVILSNTEHLILHDHHIGDDFKGPITNTNLSLEKVQRNYIIKELMMENI